MASRQMMDELKGLIIERLNLEGMKIEDISDTDALFGEGLGLDSVDALELSLAISQKYDILINNQVENVKEIFANIENLANFIESKKK